jgi:hypothetical protein
MANVYVDHKDTIVEDLVNEAIGRLKNARSVKPLGYHDGAKPSLDYSGGAPLQIKKTSAWPKKMRIDRP